MNLSRPLACFAPPPVLCAVWLSFASFLSAAAPIAATQAEAPAARPSLESASLQFTSTGGWEIRLEVLAWDRGSAFFVRDLARRIELMLEQVFQGTFTSIGPREPAAWNRLDVNIELLSRGEAHWDGPFRAFSMRGRDVLAVKWSRDTRLEDLQVGLVRASLARLVLACAAKTQTPSPSEFAAPTAPVSAQVLAPVAALSFETAFAAIPGWLVDAFLVEMEARANLGLIPVLLAESRHLPPPALAAVGAQGSSRSTSFLFFRHVRRELRRAGIPEIAFLAGLLQDGAPAEILRRHFPEIAADPDQSALWWPVGFVGLTRASSRFVQTIRESAMNFERATGFLLAPAGVDRRFRADALPALRALPAARHAVAARLQRLRGELPSVNPVWHNAFQSYGVFLERFPSATDFELARLWKQVEADVAAARFLQRSVEQALRAN